MEEGGYAAIVKPPGHEEYLKAKALEQQAKLAEKALAKGEAKAKGKKRKLDADETEDTVTEKKAAGDSGVKSKTEAKSKVAVASYKIGTNEKALLKEDSLNKKLWAEVLSGKYLNKKEMTDKIEEQFCCMICQDLVFKPVSNTCLT